MHCKQGKPGVSSKSRCVQIAFKNGGQFCRQQKKDERAWRKPNCISRPLLRAGEERRLDADHVGFHVQIPSRIYAFHYFDRNIATHLLEFLRTVLTKATFHRLTEDLSSFKRTLFHIRRCYAESGVSLNSFPPNANFAWTFPFNRELRWA
jgi:hypothetical protein